jgi:hypothetical protein
MLQTFKFGLESSAVVGDLLRFQVFDRICNGILQHLNDILPYPDR